MLQWWRASIQIELYELLNGAGLNELIWTRFKLRPNDKYTVPPDLSPISNHGHYEQLNTIQKFSAK